MLIETADGFTTKQKFLIILIGFTVFTVLISYFAIDNNKAQDQDKHEIIASLLSDSLSEFKDILEAEPPTKSPKNESLTTVTELLKSNYPRIFCMILTAPKNLDTKAKAVFQTWAPGCDNFKFISVIPNIPNSSNLSESIEVTKPFPLLQPKGLVDENYEKLTDKVYFTIRDVYKRYGDYDWYLKADDDTFIFTENLRHFLKSKNSSIPVTYGYNFKVIVEKGYHSGGGGYLMSREALTRLGSRLDKDMSLCPNSGTEDVDVAKCLRQLKVYPGRSLDELSRERFHPLDIETHYLGQFPDWMHQYAENKIATGHNCCSDTSVSFHYMSSENIYRIYKMLRKYNNSITSLQSSSNPNQTIFQEIAKDFNLQKK